jgi:hypothetical protein
VYYVLGCDAVQSDRNSLMFQMSQRCDQKEASNSRVAGCLPDILIGPEDAACMFF